MAEVDLTLGPAVGSAAAQLPVGAQRAHGECERGHALVQASNGG